MKWLLLPMICCGVGCDNSQAFHDPHPSLERMQTQVRVTPFDAHGMRSPPPDTVSRDTDDTSMSANDAGGIPLPVDETLLHEGQASFDRVCATCHGVLGDGNSVVASKMQQRPPPSLHEPRIVALSAQQTFGIITSGYGLMPSYAHLLDPRDRWAVVAYLDALRLSRHAVASDLPPDVQTDLAREAAK